ncbi:hypothetical protein IW148_001509 [Coemansia sp. RSA 1199]|nr:hypothetical protein IW148_001509 [Coemansia sp. RSA 1199]
MESTLSHKSDGRTITGCGPNKRRIMEVESAQAGPSHAGSPPLLIWLSLPPAGYESQFNTWARCWRQCHGYKEPSIKMQLEISRFVQTVENLSRPVDQAVNDAMTNADALRISLSRARYNLENDITSADPAKFNAAERVFRIYSEAHKSAIAEYKRTYAEYKSAHAEYTSQLNAATERVEQQLIREAELAISEPMVVTERTVNAPAHLTLLEGLPHIYVHPDEKPLIHSGPVRGLSDADATCDPDITYCIQDFQAQALYQHSELQRVQIPLRPAVQGKTEKHPRYLDREEDLSTFFEPEILKPVQAIVDKLNPGVLVRGQVGSAMDHADYFIVVTVEVGGVSRQSAIPVEFKMPYGLAKAPKPRSLVDAVKDNESDFDYQMRMAGLPTRDYGRLAIGQQLRAYVRVRNIANHAPANIAGCLNRKYGILTDYNQTWIIEFEQLSTNRDDRYDDDQTESLNIIVSDRFVVGNVKPHMAFVYAYVVSEVVEDIRANPNAYSRAPVDIHRQDPGPGRAIESARRESSRGLGQTRGSSKSGKSSKLINRKQYAKRPSDTDARVR